MSGCERDLLYPLGRQALSTQNRHPDPLWLYHITHVSNVNGILQQGGLVANNVLQENYLNIAHQSIQTRRHSQQVSCGLGGVLHDYVPFYFCRKSPMLYAIHKQQVEGYSGSQAEVVYLLVRFDSIRQSELNWVFSDGHAAMALSDFYDDAARLDQIDWPLMKAQYWFDTDDDPDRKRRRQAEFLIHATLPWSHVAGIAVYDEAHRKQVEGILSNTAQAHKPAVKVLRKWYY